MYVHRSPSCVCYSLSSYLLSSDPLYLFYQLTSLLSQRPLSKQKQKQNKINKIKKMVPKEMGVRVNVVDMVYRR